MDVLPAVVGDTLLLLTIRSDDRQPPHLAGGRGAERALPVLEDLVEERMGMPSVVLKLPRVAIERYLAMLPGSHLRRPASTRGVWERRDDAGQP